MFNILKYVRTYMYIHTTWPHVHAHIHVIHTHAHTYARHTHLQVSVIVN